jgi:hypothetical protein
VFVGIITGIVVLVFLVKCTITGRPVISVSIVAERQYPWDSRPYARDILRILTTRDNQVVLEQAAVDHRRHLESPIFAFFMPQETKTPLQIIFHLDEMMKLLHVHLGFWSFRLNSPPLRYA